VKLISIELLSVLFRNIAAAGRVSPQAPALFGTGRGDPMRIDNREVEITSPDRVLFPKDGVTKADLVRYYAQASPVMLPFLRDRALNMQRFPRGIQSPGFVQQEAPPQRPEWVRTITVEKEGGETTHLVCDNAATLVWMANLSCITPHVWLSCTRHADVPDRLIFDLDPAEDDFETVRRAARQLRELLEERGLPAFPMTTGSRGLHVTIPLRPKADFDSIRDYSQELADELVRRDPGKLTTEIQKDDRGGRLFVDTLRNAYGHTAVAPYSVRARDGAPVARPVRWEDLEDRKLTARSFTMRNAEEWLEDAKASWQSFEKSAVELDLPAVHAGRR
jgi:bifunctional non-homologous end joining protein LigD